MCFAGYATSFQITNRKWFVNVNGVFMSAMRRDDFRRTLLTSKQCYFKFLWFVLSIMWILYWRSHLIHAENNILEYTFKSTKWEIKSIQYIFYFRFLLLLFFWWALWLAYDQSLIAESSVDSVECNIVF